MTEAVRFPELTELFLEVTNACTHKCIHCAPRSSQSYADELTCAEMKLIVQQAHQLGLRFLYLTGGEPLLRPACVCKLITEAGQQVATTVLTNGTIFDHQFVHLMKKEHFPAAVCCTVFSANANVHDRITCIPGSLAAMLRSSAAYVQNGVVLKWSFPLTALNLHAFDDVLHLASRIGVRELGVSRVVPSGRAADNWWDLAVSSAELAAFLIRLRATITSSSEPAVRVSKTLANALLGFGNAHNMCNAGRTRLFVQANGRTFPCPAFKDLPSFEGKTVKSDSLSHVWSSSAAFQTLRSYAPTPDGPCFSCGDFSSCGGHCRAQHIHNSGDLNKGADPFCPRSIRSLMTSDVTLEDTA